MLRPYPIHKGVGNNLIDESRPQWDVATNRGTEHQQEDHIVVRRRRPGCLQVIILAIVFTFSIAVAVSLIQGKPPLSFFDMSEAEPTHGVEEFPPLDEVWTHGEGDSKVVHIRLNGMITMLHDDGFFSSSGGATAALDAIRRATMDTAVNAIIIELDSGGGGITASDIIYKALLDFKSSAQGRVVVALCGDVTASGAYYVALAAAHIIARPPTITGSIGVLVQGMNLLGLGAKLGIEGITIKSGDNKDMLNPLSEFTEGQRVMLQGVVDELHRRFSDLVVKHRPMTREEVTAIADGTIFTASQAQELKLIDEIGYWKEAMNRTSELLGVSSIMVFRYEEAFSLASFLRGRSHWNPAALLNGAGETRFLYQWKP